MQNPQDKSMVRITNGERILRVFTRICQSQLQIFMRPEPNATILVKGKASALANVHGGKDGPAWTFKVNGVSAAGVNCLKARSSVQVEFVLVNSKIVCQASILEQQGDGFTLALPTSLLSLERRSGVRYRTTETARAYVQFGLWKALDDNDFGMSPYFPPHRDLAAMLTVNDISQGGVSLVCRFPGIARVIAPLTVDTGAQLYLPMQAPMRMGLDVRWIKKLVQHQDTAEGGQARPITSYLVGCQFSSATDEQLGRVRRLLQELMDATAI